MAIRIVGDKPLSKENSVETYAALDLGSNSFHLLVARLQGGKLEVLDRHKDNVRLGSGLRKDGSLSKKAIERALDSLRLFAERLRSTPNARLRVVGTNTLRAASNSDSFLARAEEILQTPINIISGIEEARLIYQGVAHDFSPDGGKRLVIDIGGGSTELIVGENKPQRLESLYMGCVSFSRRFFPDGVISVANYQRAVMAARQEAQGAASTFSSKHWVEAVGASGTIKAIESILEGMGLNEEHTITLEGMEVLAKFLCEFEHSGDLRMPNLSPERRAVLPGGLAVLHGIFLELGIERMHVSAYAIREGIILDLAGRLRSRDVRADTVQRMMVQYHVDEPQSERVITLLDVFMQQLVGEFGSEHERVQKLLVWAASLHEIGLSVAHSSYHKHSAYLLLHSDMPGFSKQEQKMLSFLAHNHRRKLNSLPQTYGFDPDWRLVQLLRLACLFCRRRDDAAVPADIGIIFKDERLILTLPKTWLEQHPLTAEVLEAEKKYQRAQGLELLVK